MSNIKKNVLDNISEYGLAVLGVGADPEENVPSFSYSIGLTLNHGCEILIEGLPFDISKYLINTLASSLPFYGISLGDTCIVKGLLKNDIPVALIKTDSPDVKLSRTIQVAPLVGRIEYSVMQVVVPDVNGIFPWEAGFDHGMGKQDIHCLNGDLSAIARLMASVEAYDINPDSVFSVDPAVAGKGGKTRH